MTDDTPPVNRYSAMANEAELNLWHGTFKTFDRDGGGDVDLRELGMMFRQLGQAPNEREMRLLIEEVDADGSGTIDFEEFCCLMLRQARSARTPEWMVELLPADADEEEVAALPSVAMLSDAKHVAARMIQKKMAARRGGAASSAPSDPKLAPPAALFDEDLTREQLLMVVDLLPSAVHVTEAHLAGHGSRFGPFVAAELAWRLATSTRTRISSLDLAFNGIGDEGAAAIARTLRQNTHLRHLDLSGNGISQRGASALMGSLCMLQPSGRKPPLRSLSLDENLMSAEMSATIQAQLLLNNLSVAVAEATLRPVPTSAAEAAAAAKAPVTLSLAAAGSGAGGGTEAALGMELGERPSCRLSEEWLSQAHSNALREQLQEAGVRSLHLHQCTRFADAALGALLVPPPAAPGLPKGLKPEFRLHRLRVSSSGMGDGIVAALIAAVQQAERCQPLEPTQPHALTHARLPLTRLSSTLSPLQGTSLALLRGLALDDNSISLSATAAVPAFNAGPGRDGHGGPASALGAALRGLAYLEQLDLSNNAMLRDAAAAELCASLLAASPTGQGASHAPPMKLLHLGGTGAGNSAAASCAEALASPHCALGVLCLSGDVSDVGARALAGALAAGCALRELYLGDKISDAGVEKLFSAVGQKDGPCTLELLCLGGLVRGGVRLTNRLDARAAQLLGESLRINPDGPLQELRLSGNAGIGGAACLGLVGSLRSCSALRTLHIEGCGWAKPDMANLVETMYEVWCLHELVIDRKITPGTNAAAASSSAASTPAAAPPPAALKKAGGAWGGGGKLLSMQQRMALAKVLEDNKTMGERRVESWRLSRSLEEVAWVFDSLCAGMPKDVMDGGLNAWGGEACGLFVANLGLPRYTETFSFNLSGSKLAALSSAGLCQLGVTDYAEQKQVMSAVRSLVHAYERRERVAKANATWATLLGGGASVIKKDMERRERAEEEAAAARAEEERAARQAAARAEAAAEKKRRKQPPNEVPAYGVHTFQRALSPGRQRPVNGVGGPASFGGGGNPAAAAARGRTYKQIPLPLIEQPGGEANWSKRGVSKDSATYQHAAASAAAARQANFAVAGSQLRAETRELFRGLMHTLEAYPDPNPISTGEYGYGRSAPASPWLSQASPAHTSTAQQYNAATSRRLGGGASHQRLEALSGSRGRSGGGATQHALHGACEAVIATRHSEPGAAAARNEYDMGAAPSAVAPSPGPAPSYQYQAASVTIDAPVSRGGGGMKHSRSSGALQQPRHGAHATTTTTPLASSASVAALPNVRKAYSANPVRWQPPPGHHPRVTQPPGPVLATWSDAAGPRGPASTGLTAKERSLQRTEAVLNDRLASASASLQTFKMATLEVAEGGSPPPQVQGGFVRRSPHKSTKPRQTGEEGGGYAQGGGGGGYKPRAPPSDNLALVGQPVPSSNERLGLILSDLMR